MSQVYPGRVMTRRMTRQQADYQIGIMRSIVEDYEKLAQKEKLL